MTTTANQNKDLLCDRLAPRWKSIIPVGSLSGSNVGYNKDYTYLDEPLKGDYLFCNK